LYSTIALPSSRGRGPTLRPFTAIFEITLLEQGGVRGREEDQFQADLSDGREPSVGPEP
jgi:hypothetical protein